MPIVLILLGVYVIVVAVRGYISTLGSLLKGDLVGSGSFGFWLLAIMAVGLLGYVKGPARIFSNALLLLIIIVIFLSNGGVWGKLVAAIQNPAAALPVQSVTVSGGSASPATAANNSSPITGAISAGISAASGGFFGGLF